MLAATVVEIPVLVSDLSIVIFVDKAAPVTIFLAVIAAACKASLAIVINVRVALAALRADVLAMLLWFVNGVSFVEWFYMCDSTIAAERSFFVSDCSSGCEYGKQGSGHQCQWFTAHGFPRGKA